MKILTLNANIRGIGTYQRCFYFSRELARRGHDVTMITVSRLSQFHPRVYYKCDWVGEHPTPAGDGPWVKMIEGPGWGYKFLPGWGSGPLDIWLRIGEIWEGNYDLVYGFEYQPNVSWPIYLTKCLRRYRFFSDWCDWYAGGSNKLRGIKLAHKIDAFFEERIRFLAEKVTTVSRALEQRAISIGIPPTRVVLVPQGVDTEYVRPYPQQRVRRKFGLPLDIPIMAIVADRDMRAAIRVFAKVRRMLPGTRLLIIGRKRESVLETASELNVSGFVIETGWVLDEEYVQYLACADVCFLLLKEGVIDRGRWPGKVNDYLAAGKATIVNDVGDVTALFKQYEIGLLAGQSEDAFAESIVALLKDEERCRYYGENARRLMVEEWDWQVLGEQIARVVEA
jgi:glycosyltransferase involved in cell wall biosynthesis